MHKLLIAEDEKWERDGLVDYLDWSRMGIRIAGAAANGAEGLKLAKEYRPDIIITDIRMPVMDGIEFIREVRSFLPDCCIIILTGYDDFGYAREAIQLGVIDYLLKPVDKDQLVNVLNKTLARISEGIRQADHIGGMKRKIAERMREDRERLLLDIIEGSADYRNDTEAEHYLDAICAKEGFKAVLVRFSSSSHFGKARIEGRISPGELVADIRKIVGDEGIIARSGAGSNEIIIFAPSGGDDRNHINGVIRRIRHKCCGPGFPESVVGVGPLSKSLQSLPDSYKKAQTALEKIFFMKDAWVLFYDDISSSAYPHEAEIYDFFACAAGYSKKILNGIVSLEPRKVAAVSEELFEFIRTRSVGKEPACNYIAGLIGEITTLLINYDRSFTREIINEDIMGAMNGFIKLEEMKHWFQEFILQANDRISGKKKNKEEIIVGKVMDIIRGEYESSIGIETIARRLELSPNYLGSLFRQHAGKRFTEVLTDIRMKKAEELLVSGEENLVGTAKSVGFINAAHFCKVFKKVHGISPMDFRRRQLEKKADEGKNYESL